MLFTNTCRDVLRTQLNIYDEALSPKWLTAKSRYLFSQKKLQCRCFTGFLIRLWIVILFGLWCLLTNRNFNFGQVHEFVLNFCDFGKKNPTSFISNLREEIENLKINLASHAAFHKCFKKRYFENMR